MATGTHIQSFPFFDNVEVLNASAYVKDFPLHFHDVISLTLVQQGLECTEVQGKKLLTPPGSISFTYPDEIHANPNVNDGSYSFLTYYFSPDVLRYYNQGRDFRFKTRVVQDPVLYQMLYQWATSPRKGEPSELGLSKNLAYGGGCALNSATNSKLIQQSKFERLHVPFAPGDDGNALGVALYEKYGVQKEPREAKIMLPYLGSTINLTRLERILSFKGTKFHYIEDEAALCSEVASFLANGKITRTIKFLLRKGVVWFFGAKTRR